MPKNKFFVDQQVYYFVKKRWSLVMPFRLNRQHISGLSLSLPLCYLIYLFFFYKLKVTGTWSSSVALLFVNLFVYNPFKILDLTFSCSNIRAMLEGLRFPVNIPPATRKTFFFFLLLS